MHGHSLQRVFICINGWGLGIKFLIGFPTHGTTYNDCELEYVAQNKSKTDNMDTHNLL